MRFLMAALLACVPAAFASLVSDVRAAIAKNDFRQGESLIAAHRSTQGVTPDMILALSWLGRGALAAKEYDKADAYAVDTRRLALDELKKRKLDDETNLPLALGASIEVQAHVLDARGQRGDAVSLLRRELSTYRDTSIRARIQKNIHLLSLEGKPAPALDAREYLGPKPEPVERLKGRPLVLFFWAHWCSDCKRQGPVLARLAGKYASKGLLVIGPTQRFGYVARGREAAPEVETPYIDEVRKTFYSALSAMPVPLSEENFNNWGVSTTPTLVLVDRKGIVRLYHPGQMAEDQLDARTREIVE